MTLKTAEDMMYVHNIYSCFKTSLWWLRVNSLTWTNLKVMDNRIFMVNVLCGPFWTLVSVYSIQKLKEKNNNYPLVGMYWRAAESIAPSITYMDPSFRLTDIFLNGNVSPFGTPTAKVIVSLGIWAIFLTEKNQMS